MIAITNLIGITLDHLIYCRNEKGRVDDMYRCPKCKAASISTMAAISLSSEVDCPNCHARLQRKKLSVGSLVRALAPAVLFSAFFVLSGHWKPEISQAVREHFWFLFVASWVATVLISFGETSFSQSEIVSQSN